MSGIAIRLNGVGKEYRIGKRERYRTFRDTLTDMAKAPFRRIGSLFGSTTSTDDASPDRFWALKDVSFEVPKGAVIGLIGRNGAGKSTLLKILSRITEPTKGRVELHGRVGSLLEVGTGFHPELTGRENIFLNGAILGMRRAEITGKFDEMVAFAEVDRFIDTPVKHYSSGMFMRLAFAVAAHLEPEILLVDEVLAVGDAEFQKKCLGKMNDVAREGRTVVFVSHNLAAIERLCDRSIWLEAGTTVRDGLTHDVVSAYQSHYIVGCHEWSRPDHLPRQPEVEIRAVSVDGRDGQRRGFFAGNEPITVRIEYDVKQALTACQIGIRVYTSEGVVAFTTTDTDGRQGEIPGRNVGPYRARFTIPGSFLAPDAYSIFAAAHWPSRAVYDIVEQTVVFEVSGSGSLAGEDRRLGIVTPLLAWTTEGPGTIQREASTTAAQIAGSPVITS